MKKNLEGETQTARGLPNSETGNLIDGIQQALKVIEEETSGLSDPYDSPSIEIMRQASLRMFDRIANPLRFALALHAQRVKLISSDSQSPEVSGGNQNAPS